MKSQPIAKELTAAGLPTAEAVVRPAPYQRRMIVPTADTNNDLVPSHPHRIGRRLCLICPGIPGAVSQGADKEEALKMIADAMAMAQMYPLPGDDDPARQAELREIGKAKIAGGASQTMRGRGSGVSRLRGRPETNSAMARSGIADASVHSGSYSAGTAANFTSAQFQ